MPATPKQLATVAIMSHKIRKGLMPTMGEVMREAGYSESYSKKPHRLTKSEEFQREMDRVMPPQLRAVVLGELVLAEKSMTMDFPIGVPDKTIRSWMAKMGNVRVITTFKYSDTKRRVLCMVPDTKVRLDVLTIALRVTEAAERSNLFQSEEDLSEKSLAELTEIVEAEIVDNPAVMASLKGKRYDPEPKAPQPENTAEKAVEEVEVKAAEKDPEPKKRGDPVFSVPIDGGSPLKGS